MAEKTEKPKKLTAAEYWEWRCTIEEMKSAKINEKRIHLEKEIMNKEIENRKLRLALFKESVASARSEVTKSNEEYEKMKQRIEKRLKISLDNCVIDEVSYEITKLDD